MKKALVAIVLSPLIFAGSAGNYYTGYQVEPSLLQTIQQKADSAVYAKAEIVDSLCRRPYSFVKYCDLDKRPDGRIFQWETWMVATGSDTLYSHTEIKRIR